MNTTPHTPEAKAKISMAMKGNKNRLGYICTDRTRQRMSAAQKKWHKARTIERILG